MESAKNPVKEVRLALGYSQEKFAREMHCSTAAVRKWEALGALPLQEAMVVNFNRLAAEASNKLPKG